MARSILAAVRRSGLTITISYNHCGALVRKCPGDPGTDTLGSARNHRNPALKAHDSLPLVNA